MIREINQKIDMGKNSFWNEEVIICELDKKGKGFIRFSLCNKDGKEFVSIREFTIKGDDEIPTKKGMTIAREYLEEFIKSLEKI